CVFCSGRRRHTRFSRDWSSDVCSSDLDAELGRLAAYERLQAPQAIEAAAQARSSTFEGAHYVAERRVQIAEVAARTEALEREADRLDRGRSELIVEGSRRDAAAARAGAGRPRLPAESPAGGGARPRAPALTG